MTLRGAVCHIPADPGAGFGHGQGFAVPAVLGRGELLAPGSARQDEVLAGGMVALTAGCTPSHQARSSLVLSPGWRKDGSGKTSRNDTGLSHARALRHLWSLFPSISLSPTKIRVYIGHGVNLSILVLSPGWRKDGTGKKSRNSAGASHARTLRHLFFHLFSSPPSQSPLILVME